MLTRMYEKRVKGYKAIGYSVQDVGKYSNGTDQLPSPLSNCSLLLDSTFSFLMTKDFGIKRFAAA
jgi:hypothetical protein